MARIKFDPTLRAQFKEEARRILSLDRAANRMGKSQNTIGEIERALVVAFKLGSQSGGLAASAKEPKDCIDWILIPPRSRDVLWHMTLSFSSFQTAPTFVPDSLIRSDNEPKTRWFSLNENGRSFHDRGFLDGPVQKLVQMGLLAPSQVDLNSLDLTELGNRSCVEYWRRSDANDPSLPIMSVRG